MDIVFAEAHELAAAIRSRRVSALEVLDAHIAQIDRHNPQLNVIVTRDDGRARARARDADAALARGENWGPLHGVPVTIKDAYATAGVRTTSGNPPWADFVPKEDAPAVARLRAAGAIIIGKTNLPTLSMDYQASNPIFGRTNNPWDVTRTCGGSTGGAAAVAAGLSPLELGSDLGGSVRVPAHFCGVFGLKPGDFRVSSGGYHPNPSPAAPDVGGPAQLAVYGPLARSIDDLALAFQILAGPGTRGWQFPPVPVEPLPTLTVGELHLAWADDFPGREIDSDTRNALAELISALHASGCDIRRCQAPPFDPVAAEERWGEQVCVATGQNPSFLSGWLAHGDQEPWRRGMLHGMEMSLQDFLASQRARSVLISKLEALFDRHDAFVCPVAATPAFPHCESGSPIHVDDHPSNYGTAVGSFVRPFNLTGHPVVVVPVGRSRDGLPIGVQVVGRRWGEMRLLAVAKCISEVVGGFTRPPGY